jgi:large subunit ribosomal protein L3
VRESVREIRARRQEEPIVSFEMIARKLGMTQIFDESGDCVPVTVLRAGPVKVVQKKTQESDGYTAVQVGFEDCKAKHTPKPLQGHFAKAGVGPMYALYEIRLPAAEVEALTPGQELTIEGRFEAGQRIDVTGTTKGRGFTGVVKRHNFPTFRSSHGTHEYFRHGGSMGSGTEPGRILKNKKMAGHYGDEQVTTIGLRVERVDAERNLIYVRGAVPGHREGLVRIRPTVRGRK